MAGRQRYKSGPKKGKFMSNRAIAAKRSRNAKTKKKTTALVKRGKTKSMAKKKTKSRRKGKRKGGSISTAEIKDLMVGGAIYGYITEPDAEDAGEMRTSIVSTLAKMPNLGNRDISNGLALYLIDKHVYSNKYLKATAKAALVAGAVRFGRRGMKLGGEDHDELAGGWDEAADVTGEGETISGVMD